MYAPVWLRACTGERRARIWKAMLASRRPSRSAGNRDVARTPRDRKRNEGRAQQVRRGLRGPRSAWTCQCHQHYHLPTLPTSGAAWRRFCPRSPSRRCGRGFGVDDRWGDAGSAGGAHTRCDVVVHARADDSGVAGAAPPAPVLVEAAHAADAHRAVPDPGGRRPGAAGPDAVAPRPKGQARCGPRRR